MFKIFEKKREEKRTEQAEATMYPEQKAASDARKVSLEILGKDGILTGTWTEVHLPSNHGNPSERFNIEDGIINGHKVSGSFTVGVDFSGGLGGAPRYCEESNLYIDGRPLSQEEGRAFFEKFGRVALDKNVEEEASKSVESAQSQLIEKEKNRIKREEEEKARKDKESARGKIKNGIEQSLNEKLGL